MMNEQRIKELEAEVTRLKAGRFTSEELQELCHNLSTEDACVFRQGCERYQRQLFGDEITDKLKAAESVPQKIVCDARLLGGREIS